jgi:CRP-like cAMP-binding protein
LSASRRRILFLLLDGHVRVVRTTPQGREVIIRYISPGELLGIAIAVSRATYPATAVAAIDCVVLAWPSQLWPDFAAAYPGFAGNAYKTIGDRLQDAHARVIELSTAQVDQRVALALVKLAQQTGKPTAEVADRFPDLASGHCGDDRNDASHREPTSDRMAESGLVKSGRQKVTVVDSDRLLALAEAAPS